MTGDVNLLVRVHFALAAEEFDGRVVKGPFVGHECRIVASNFRGQSCGCGFAKSLNAPPVLIIDDALVGIVAGFGKRKHGMDLDVVLRRFLTVIDEVVEYIVRDNGDGFLAVLKFGQVNVDFPVQILEHDFHKCKSPCRVVTPSNCTPIVSVKRPKAVWQK